MATGPKAIQIEGEPSQVEALRAELEGRGFRVSPGERAGGGAAFREPSRLVGRHPAIEDLERSIDRLSRLPATVLILGESGTGKELVARAIHERSPRSAEPFLGVNCGAFARGLLEDQLFGHVRGAFTGALADQEGVFRGAGNGTLFLDEVAEMDTDLQGRLLRALESREVVPIGSNRAVPFEARLIAATNRDLESLVERGSFRRDLFYRLNAVQIRVPPLRERRDDIPLLAEFFLGRLSLDGAPRKRLSPQALEALLAHSYPGNVRELRNAIERALALGRSPEILPEDLPKEFQAAAGGGRFKTLAESERDHVLQALRLSGGRKNLAAKLLAIDRNRLARLLKRLGIAAGGGARAL